MFRTLFIILTVTIILGCSSTASTMDTSGESDTQVSDQSELGGSPGSEERTVMFVQNLSAEKLVNHTWLIDHSKKPGSAKNCGDPECLNVNDYIKIIANEPVSGGEGASLILVIKSMADDQIYHFHSIDSKITMNSSEPYVESVWMKFIDNVGEEPYECRQMTLQSVKLKDYKDDPQDCNQELGGFPHKLSSSEITKACNRDNMVYWVVDDAEACNPDTGIRARFDPEPGQGTASGTQ